jgi:hypothetical protein
MRNIVAGFATAVFALVAIAAAPQATATPEDEFLKALASSGISFPAEMTGEVISGGHAVCQGWASGASSADIVSAVTGASGLGASEAGVIVRAATKTLCPKYTSKL